MSDGDYSFPSIPVSPVPPGTNILVEGPYHAGTRDLASRLLTPGEKEAQVIVSTNSNAGRLYREWQGLGLDFGEQTAILDCVSTAEPDLPARIHHVSGPQDLTGITIRLSKAYQDFYRDSLSRIRLGIFSVTTMLTIGDVRPVFRFVNTVAGRISNFGGLGVFLVDPATHDERTIETLAHFTHGRIQVRETGDTIELRSRGLPAGSRNWRPLEL